MRRLLRGLGIVALALLVGTGLAVTAIIVGSAIQKHRVHTQQAPLEAFYTPPATLPNTLGTVLRQEPLGISVAGGQAYRILYVSERPDGTRAASGAMLFIPDAPAPAQGRPVLAWAHGTLGLGDSCAPSRSTNPTGDMYTWLPMAMQMGWVVVATDYVGVGTPGPNLYLDADSEVRDVVNSVRAARLIPAAQAGTRYVTFGHSQGGHSSIWSGHLAPAYGPELQLLGVAAAAPALELPAIMTAQWNTVVGWVIGPDAVESWSHIDPNLTLDGVLSPVGLRNWHDIAYECVKNSFLTLAVRQTVGERFFAMNPSDNASWKAMADRQTPAPLPASMPAFISQGTTDTVVLPWPQAIVQDTWCKAGSTLTMDWLGDVGHVQAALVSGPTALTWIADRFAGKPAGTTCAIPSAVPPIPPANPANPSS